MSARVFDLFDQLLAMQDAASVRSLVFQNPVLLSTPALRALIAKYEAGSTASSEQAMGVLAQLDEFRLQLVRRPELWPPSEGPLERLLQQLAAGELDEVAVRTRAGTQAFAERISAAAYLQSFLQRWLNASQHGDWRPVKQAIELTRTALVTDEGVFRLDATVYYELYAVLCDYYVLIARSVLVAQPDGRLLRRAVELGKWYLEDAHRRDQDGMRGEGHHGLGCLYLDPYVVAYGLTPDDPERIKAMMATAKGAPMLDAGDALERAVEHLDAACQFREGEDLGLTLKALAQALFYRAWLKKESPPRERIVEVAEEAIARLPGPDHEPVRAYLLELIAVVEGTARPPEAPRRVSNGRAASDRAVAVEALIADAARDPIRAYEALERLVPDLRDEELDFPHIKALSAMSDLLPAVLRTEADTRPMPEATLARTAADVIARVNALLAEQRPGEAAEQMAELRRSQPALGGRHEAVLAFLEGSGWLAAAAGASGHDRARALAHALFHMARAERKATVEMLLDELLEALVDADSVRVEAMLAGLVAAALHVELRWPDSAGLRLNDIVRRALRAVLAGPVNDFLCCTLIQLLKGLRFKHRLQTPALTSREGDEIEALSARIDGLWASAPTLTGKSAVEELLLQSDHPVVLSDEPLAHLQRRFEVLVRRRQLAGVVGHVDESTLATPEAMQRALGREEVLLNYVLTGDARGEIASVDVHVVCRESMLIVRGRIAGQAAATFTVGPSGREYTVSAVGVLLWSFRQNLQLQPLIGDIDSGASDLLEMFNALLLGPSLRHELRRLRDLGKRHLTICPHGPLHFFPFCLLSDDEGLLVDRWTLNQIPNIGLLMGRRDDLGVRTTRDVFVSVFAKSFADLEENVAEARGIAQIFDARPILDAGATPGSFLEGLRTARHVHIATHGELRPEAPAFHSLVLSPDDASASGRIFAHQVEDHPLHGLELVTLSACETGLGRFDAADNLTGFPAALFVAGAASIVATLWPVDDRASRLFFETLYSEVRAAKSVQSAFHRAQQVVRTRFREPRSWAAFVLMPRAGSMAGQGSDGPWPDETHARTS